MHDENLTPGHAQFNGSTDDDTADRDPVEQLAAEYAERYRDGERVSVEEYAREHPEHAAEIRDLFPTIVAMERLHTKRMLENGGTRTTPLPTTLGDYRVIGEVARGGMGIVYEAEQISLGRRVAVKVLPQNALRRARDVKRFEREAQTAAKLHHSNIVPVFGVGEDKGYHYIVMQLIRGVGLDEILDEIKQLAVNRIDSSQDVVTTARSNTIKRSAAELLETKLCLNSTVASHSNITHPDTVDDGVNASRPQMLSGTLLRSTVGPEYYKNVARIGLQAAEALSYAHHRGTLHRDVKPGNLLLDEDGRVWIADFGLAKAVQDDSVTCSGDVVGTMAYVAPERFRGTTTKSSDIYSLGITLYEMLAFQKAFDGKDRVAVLNQVTNGQLVKPRQLNSAVPRDLETIILKAAAHDPKDRYASADLLACDLDAYLADRPIQARRLSKTEHAVRWCRRNRATAALCASVLFLLATVFGVTVSGYLHAERQRLRAEATAGPALTALEEIYSRFATAALEPPMVALTADVGGEPGEPVQVVNSRQMPISKDVAALLQNLLTFYDQLSQQNRSDEVDTKYIAANRRVGDIRRRLGQFDEAHAAYLQAIGRIEKLSIPLRDTEVVRLETARIQNGLGIVLYGQKQVQGSVNAHLKAIAILAHSTATEQERFELANSYYLLHRVKRFSFRGGLNRDDASLNRAKTILGELSLRRPNAPSYQLLLARCLIAEKSDADAEEAKHGGLGKNQEEAIAILETLFNEFPDSAEYQFELGQAYHAVESNACGMRSWTPARLNESETRLRRGLSVTADLETRHPNIPQYYMLKKRLHDLLGRVLQYQGRPTEALDEYETAIQKQLELMGNSHDAQGHEFCLYRLELRYGKLLRDTDKVDQAETLLESTARGLEQLAEQQSEQSDPNHWAEKTLAQTYIALSSISEARGDESKARDLLAKAEALGR